MWLLALGILAQVGSLSRSLRRIAQYFFIRADTSRRSVSLIDFRPRRLAVTGNLEVVLEDNCNSSNTKIARSSFSFWAYNPCKTL
jgi:hypothetical protein